jgi:hypothetical protein
MLTYEKWLNCIFGRSANQEVPESKFDAPTTVEYIHRTFVHSGSDLLRFSDKQVKNGINAIFNNSFSNIIFTLKEPTVPGEARTAAIRAIKILYTDCFEKRARPVLGHLDEPGASPINSVCYMLWDTNPMSSWGNKGDCEYFELILEVLEFALYLKNPACVESALHGLGHMAIHNKRVYKIIGDWIKPARTNRSALLRYAAQAQLGDIL